jgi:hypothetical protein
VLLLGGSSAIDCTSLSSRYHPLSFFLRFVGVIRVSLLLLGRWCAGLSSVVAWGLMVGSFGVVVLLVVWPVGTSYLQFIQRGEAEFMVSAVNLVVWPVGK